MQGGEGDRGGRFFDLEAEAEQRPRQGELQPARDGRAPRPAPRRRRAEPATGPTSFEPPAARRRSETWARILWAVPWAAFAIAIVVIGGPVFAAAMLGLALICQNELFGMARASRPLGAVALVVTVGLAAAAYFGYTDQLVLIALATLPLMFVAAATRGSAEGLTASFAITLLGVVWIGLPFAHAILLREIPSYGAGLVVDVLLATFISDTAAYAGGRMLGRHLLAPALSPRKTIEGFGFGLVGGTAAFWFAGLYQDWLSGTDALLIGLCVAIVAPIGDLFESVMKRDLGVKDSGRAIGPHGGLLDRLDAVLFTIVAGYYLALAFGY